jgi:hypothetical protein
MRRSQAQQRAWKRLSPRQRKLLMSHLPDEMEQDERLVHSVLTALSNVYGPRLLGTSAARVEDGEDVSGWRRRRLDREPPWSMTHKEIGVVLGITASRVQVIEQEAFRKFRTMCRRYGFDLHGFVSVLFRDTWERFSDVEHALVVAKRQAKARQDTLARPEQIEAALKRARMV